MRRTFLSARLWPVACVLLAATACAEPASPDSATATTSDAAPEAALPPVTPPPMAVEPPPRRMPGSGEAQRCDADAAREVVGREATADLVEEARSAAGADRVRVLEPGQMVTMEYHPSRLTLDVDERNIVVNVRCG